MSRSPSELPPAKRKRGCRSNNSDRLHRRVPQPTESAFPHQPHRTDRFHFGPTFRLHLPALGETVGRPSRPVSTSSSAEQRAYARKRVSAEACACSLRRSRDLSRANDSSSTLPFRQTRQLTGSRSAAASFPGSRDVAGFPNELAIANDQPRAPAQTQFTFSVGQHTSKWATTY